MGKSHKDLWVYNTIDSTWNSLDTIPAFGRKGGVCFSYGYSLVYTAGVDQINTRLKETWKYVLPISIKENNQIINLQVYPNPVKDYLRLKFDGLENDKIDLRVINLQGQILIEEKNFNPSKNLDVSELTGGQYLISIKQNSKCGEFLFTKY